MDDLNLTELLKSFGTPAGMLAALAFFGSKAGKFFRPLVEQLFAAHIGMVNSLQKTVEKSQPMLEEQHGMVKEIHDEVVSKGKPPS